MDKTVKIFFVAVILLYSVIGVAAISVLHGPFLNNNLATINNANSSANGSSNNHTQGNPQSKYISSVKAINVVNNNVPDYGYTTYTTKLVKNTTNPYYIVNAYDQNPNSTTYKQGLNGAKVDAKTGKLLDNGTITHI